jgi:hypothetical protein
MTTWMIDLFAALLIFLAVLKLLLLSVHAPTWLLAVKAMNENRAATSVVSYFLAAVVLYGLLESGLTIVQILAVSLFTALLLIPGFAPFMRPVLHQLEGQMFRQMLAEQWLYILVWALLLGWGAWRLLLR